MPQPRRPENLYQTYHAHIYYDVHTLAMATQLCQTAGPALGVKVGRIHQKLVGPHPMWSCQLIFNRQQFDNVINWLQTHRGNLSVLVHGVTGDDMADHTHHASWLGAAHTLNLTIFRS